MPCSFRFLLRGLGTRESKSPESLSMVLFEHEYVNRLIEFGQADAEARMGDIEAFLGGERMQGLNRPGVLAVVVRSRLAFPLPSAAGRPNCR